MTTVTVALFLLFPVAVLLPAPDLTAEVLNAGWWVLALLFAAAEVGVIRVPLGHRMVSLRLGAMPLLVGLFCLDPAWLLAARCAGSALAVAVVRRRAWRDAALDLAAGGAAVVVAASTFWLVSSGQGTASVRGWVAASVALGAAALIGAAALAVAGVAGPFGPGLRSGRTRYRIGARIGTRIAVGCGRALGLVVSVLPGVLVALAVRFGPPGTLTATAAGALLVLGYRLRPARTGGGPLADGMLQLSIGLRDAAGIEAVARAVVANCPQIVDAGHAEVVVARRGARAGRGWRTWPEGGLATTSVDLAEVEILLAFPRRMISPGQDAAGDRLLAGRLLREAAVIPLPVGDGLLAALVVGQPAGVGSRALRVRDVQRITTIANQATIALRHAHALERLHHDSLHDALTGLPNRTEFRARAVEAVAGAAGGMAACAIGVLDLDGFKTVNDSLGHLAGDQVLAEVGRRMSRLAGSGLLISRLGGDEFAVLVRGVPDEQEVVELARRLLDGVHAPFTVDGEQVRLTGSLGLALGPRDGLTADQLLRNADIAMYAAKAEAGGLRVYSRELTESVDAPLSLAADLRLALARGDLTIAVQPLVDLTSGRLHSVEALARWRHPALGLINPEIFVDAAERGGLVGELTEVVINQALAACREWLDAGLEVQVAVNLAARLLSDPELPGTVERALRLHGLPGRLLCLELTETGVITSPDRALAVLNRLREFGVCLAVDDFGTGYSSMTYMNWLSPDQVKIDKSFVQRLRFDPRNEAIVRSIIDLGHNLGVAVVAEGVSDARTATVLSDFGCTLGQGYLFAEPMVPTELPEWVTGWMAVPEREDPDRTDGPDVDVLSLPA